MNGLSKLSLRQRVGAVKKFQELKSPDHRVILLLGPVGVGKSSFVNFLAGELVVEEGNGFYAVTTESSCRDIRLQERWLRVIDIPGSFDPVRNSVPDVSDNWYFTKECDLMNAEFVKALLAAGPEIHAVGLVVNIQERLGLNIQMMIGLLRELKIDMKHVMVIFTHGDVLLPSPPPTELRSRGLDCLKSLLVDVADRYVVVENLQLPERDAVIERLLRHIDSIAAHPLTNDAFCTSFQGWKDQHASREKEERELKDAKNKLAMLQCECDKTDLENLRSEHRRLQDECSDLSSKLNKIAEIEKTFAELHRIECNTAQYTADSAAFQEKLRRINKQHEQDDTINELKSKVMQSYKEKIQGFNDACINVISIRDDGIGTLENAADEINKLKRDATAAKISGYSGSIIGAAVFSVGAGLLLGGITAPVAIPLLAIGGVVGAAGSVTAIGGTIGRQLKRSRIMKKATKWLHDNKVRCEDLMNAHDDLTNELGHIAELFPGINAELPPEIVKVGEIILDEWKKIIKQCRSNATELVVKAAGSGLGVAQLIVDCVDAGGAAVAVGVKVTAIGSLAVGLSALVIVLDLVLLIKSSIELDRVRKGHSTNIARAILDLAEAVREENNLLRVAMRSTRSGVTGDVGSSVMLCNPSVVNDEVLLHNGLVCEPSPEPDSDQLGGTLTMSGNNGSNEQFERVDQDGSDESMVLLEMEEGEGPDGVYMSASTESSDESFANIQEDGATQSDTDDLSDGFEPIIVSHERPKADDAQTRAKDNFESTEGASSQPFKRKTYYSRCFTRECDLMNAEFVKALLAAGPEIHAVGLVVNIQERLGLNIQMMIGLLRELKIDMKHVMVIFTHGDVLLPSPPPTELRSRCELRCKLLQEGIQGLACLKSLLVDVADRYVVVENLQFPERAAVIERLFMHIDSIAAHPLTNDAFCTSYQWWKEQQAKRYREEQELKNAIDKLAELQIECAKTDLEKRRSARRCLESECSDISSKLRKIDEIEKTLAEVQQIVQGIEQYTDERASNEEKLTKVNKEECGLRDQEDIVKELKGNVTLLFDAMTQKYKTACINVISNRDEGIDTLENAAEEISKLMTRASAAKVSGYSVGIVGGAIFTVGAGLLLGGVTAPVAIPLLAVGGVVGTAGSVTAIGGTIGQQVKKSKIVKQANKWLKDNKDMCEDLIGTHDRLKEEHDHIVELFPCINAELPPGMLQVGEIVTTWKKLMKHSAKKATEVAVKLVGSGVGVAQGVLGGIDAGTEAAAIGVKIAAKAAGGVAIGLSAVVMLVDLGLLAKSSYDLDRARKGKPTKAAAALMKIATAVREENNLLREATGGARTVYRDEHAASVVCNPAAVTEAPGQLQNGFVDEFKSNFNHQHGGLAMSVTNTLCAKDEGVNHDDNDVSMLSLEAGSTDDPSASIVCNPAVVTEEQLQNGRVDELTFETDSNHEDECLTMSNAQVEGINHDGDDLSIHIISQDAGEGEDPITVYVPQSTDNNSSFQLNVQENSDTQSDSDRSDSGSQAVITSDTQNRFTCVIS